MHWFDVKNPKRVMLIDILVCVCFPVWRSVFLILLLNIPFCHLVRASGKTVLLLYLFLFFFFKFQRVYTIRSNLTHRRRRIGRILAQIYIQT